MKFLAQHFLYFSILLISVLFHCTFIVSHSNGNMHPFFLFYCFSSLHSSFFQLAYTHSCNKIRVVDEGAEHVKKTRRKKPAVNTIYKLEIPECSQFCRQLFCTAKIMFPFILQMGVCVCVSKICFVLMLIVL